MPGEYSSIMQMILNNSSPGTFTDTESYEKHGHIEYRYEIYCKDSEVDNLISKIKASAPLIDPEFEILPYVS